MTAVAFQGSSANIVPPTSYTVATFATEYLDTHGWHDPVTNPSRLTVPLTGWYLIHATAGGGSNAGLFGLQLRVDGSTLYARNEQGGNANLTTELLHVIRLTAGQYLELLWRASSVSDGGTVNVSVTRLPHPLFVGHNPSAGSGATALTADRDPAGWHDPAGDSSRVTVTQAGTYLVAIQATSNNRSVWYSLLRNGTLIHEGHNQVNDLVGGSAYGGITLVHLVTLAAGDYLQVSSDLGYELTTFAVALVANVKLAMATQSVGTTEGSFASQPTITGYDSEHVDTDGFHSLVTTPHRIVIPSGKAGTYWTFMDVSIQSSNILQLAKNGSAVNGTDRQGANNIGATNDKWTHGCCSWMESLAVADYFHTHVYTGPGRVTDTLGTFLGLLCLDDFVYEPGAWVPQVYRVKRP